MADLIIHTLGPQGDGIHQSDGGRIYVDRALPGDRVEAKVQRGARGVQRGDLLRVIEASPHRVVPPCPNYGVCGGCTLQHASEAFYREWKLATVRDVLARASLAPAKWLDLVFLPPGLRRRVTFAARKNGSAVTIGFFRRRSRQVTDIAACLVADPRIMELRAKLTKALVPLLPEGKTVDLFIQIVNGQFDLVLTGPVGKKGVPDFQVHEAVAQIAHDLRVSRMAWRPREHDEAEVLLEIAPLFAKFGALDVALPPLAFLQPTESGEKALVGAVMEQLPLSGAFADLFCGCGTFTGPMLDRGPVAAYEVSPAAIRALDRAKGARPLRAIARDLFRQPLTPDELKRFDGLVFDPARAGAQPQADALAKSKVPLIIGISCNPATFARDARLLVDGGYRLDTMKVIDQFAWSHHVELVASFSKSRRSG